MGDDPVEVDGVVRLWCRVSETDGLERASVLDELGGVLLEADREAEAVAVVESARAIYDAAGQAAEVARCDRNLGLVLMGIERNEEAVLHYEAALDTYDSLLMLADAAGCRQALAEISAATGKPLEALQLYDRAAGAFAEVGDAIRAGWCRFDESALLLEIDDDDGAAAALDEARRQFREERAYLFVARVDMLRAEVARRKGDWDIALALLRSSRAVFESSGSDGEVDRCDDARGEILLDAERIAEALDLLEVARSERRSLGNAVGVAWCDLHLSRAYESLGRHDEAARCRAAARAVFDAAGFDEILERDELKAA